MGIKHRNRSFITENNDDPQSSSEFGPDSPLSGDDTRAIATTTTGPSPKKSRRSIKKRVVTIPIGDIEGSKTNKGETYPPSDSWAWRKYGQKPIKGSPYPRGYYRCSSSKGCPARKQVERCGVDPTKLIVTYACEHNHSIPTNKHLKEVVVTATTVVTTTSLSPANVASSPTPSVVITSSSDDGLVETTDGGDPASQLTQVNLFGESPQLEFVGDSLLLGNIEMDHGWISDMSFDTPSLVGPTYDYADVAIFSMKEEDESLFGDLDELPECSAVFRQRIERCTVTAHLCSSTG